jgi:hypothetical protein
MEPVEIHPLDLAEIVQLAPDKRYTYCDPETFEVGGQVYHRNAMTPRRDGEHFLF